MAITTKKEIFSTSTYVRRENRGEKVGYVHVLKWICPQS